MVFRGSRKTDWSRCVMGNMYFPYDWRTETAHNHLSLIERNEDRLVGRLLPAFHVSWAQETGVLLFEGRPLDDA